MGLKSDDKTIRQILLLKLFYLSCGGLGFSAIWHAALVDWRSNGTSFGDEPMTWLFLLSGPLILLFLVYGAACGPYLYHFNRKKLYERIKRGQDQIEALFQDVYIFKLLREHPKLLAPYFVAILLNAGLFLLIISGQYFDFWVNTGPLASTKIGGPLGLYFIIFILVFNFNLSYMIVGEQLQSKLGKRKKPFWLDLIRNLIFAIPILLVFSFIVLLLLCRRSDQADNSVSISRSIFDGGLFVGLSIWVYVALAKIAFSDHTTFSAVSRSLAFIKDGRALKSAMIYSNSGIGLLFVLMGYVGLAYFSYQLGAPLDIRTILYIFGFLASTYVLTAILSRQIAFLLFYVTEQYPEVGPRLEKYIPSYRNLGLDLTKPQKV